MGGGGNIRQELVQLIQQVVVEGTKFVAAFAVRHGLHPTDVEALNVLMIAQARGTPMTAGGLAQELGVTSGAVTGVVDRLEQAGHMVRVRDQGDRRKVFLQYSPAGQALATEFFDPTGHSNPVMDQFTPTELDVVRRFLTLTSAAMATHRSALTAPTPPP